MNEVVSTGLLMGICRVFSIVLLFGLPSLARGDADDPPAVQKAEKDATASKGESRISADQVEMDMKKGLARFTGNVLVSDATMTLNCDNMTVRFSEAQKITRVEAVGHVVIVEPAADRKATAERAEYDLEKGTILLAGDPVLEMKDRKMYNAETITYDLKSGRAWTTRKPGQRPVIELKMEGGGLSLEGLGLGKPDADAEQPKDKGSEGEPDRQVGEDKAPEEDDGAKPGRQSGPENDARKGGEGG